MIEDLLSLQSQKDIEPTELFVPCSDVLYTMDFDNVQFKLCKTGIMFHAKSGYTSWIEPRCRSLFGTLTEMLGAKKAIMELSEEDLKKRMEEDGENVELIDQYFGAWTHCLEMPVASSISPTILFKTVTEFLKTFREEADRMLKEPLKEENVEELLKNDDAKKQAEFFDNLAQQKQE